MEFPEITTKQIFRSIPSDALEKVSERVWNAAFRSQGNCKIISQQKIGSGKFDAIVRYYDEEWKRYTWIMVEYKIASWDNSKDLKFNSICQLLMYLGNIFYDISLEGTDNFAGVISASRDHFLFIPKEVITDVMEEFEPIWKENFRVRPYEAFKNYDIRSFVSSRWDKIRDNSINLEDYDDPVRLDELIKNIYKEWNLL